ncbi:MAG: Mobile element protein, partial [uncultured Rubrobacteraceae bacterium]
CPKENRTPPTSPTKSGPSSLP